MAELEAPTSPSPAQGQSPPPLGRPTRPDGRAGRPSRHPRIRPRGPGAGAGSGGESRLPPRSGGRGAAGGRGLRPGHPAPGRKRTACAPAKRRHHRAGGGGPEAALPLRHRRAGAPLPGPGLVAPRGGAAEPGRYHRLLPRRGAGDHRPHEPPVPDRGDRRPFPGPLRAPLQRVDGPPPAPGRQAPARSGGERQRGAAPVHGPHRRGTGAGPGREAPPREGDRGGAGPRGGPGPAAARGPVRGGPVGARRPAAHPRAPLHPGERARGRRAHHPRLRRRGGPHPGQLRVL